MATYAFESGGGSGTTTAFPDVEEWIESAEESAGEESTENNIYGDPSELTTQDFVASVNPFRSTDRSDEAAAWLLSDEARSGELSAGELVNNLRGAGDPDSDVFRGGDPLTGAEQAGDAVNEAAANAANALNPLNWLRGVGIWILVGLLVVAYISSQGGVF
jgi:hypothetical protein